MRHRSVVSGGRASTPFRLHIPSAARTTGPQVALALAVLVGRPGFAGATDLAPPMFDVARQCDISSRHNMRAMSECVVAESEARAELLQNWNKFSNKSAETCIKAGRKAKRQPYALMAKCLSVDAVATGGSAGSVPAPTGAPR